MVVIAICVAAFAATISAAALAFANWATSTTVPPRPEGSR